MPSTLPADKDLAPSTLKVYKSRLNRLAENEHWASVAGLKKYAKKVVEHIKDDDDSEKGRLRKRGILQAIFSVLDIEYRKKSNPYYKFYQTVLPLKTSEGVDWKPKSLF